MRCLNIVNFIRGVEPRFETDLLLPVQKQMALILQHRLPATWLLQFDALVQGPFVDYLKANMAKNHEVGFWFEMNELLCNAAKVEWRGRPGYEWDHLPPVAFTIGYTPEERVKLADAAMSHFKQIWGQHPRSVASWNLDSITAQHLVDHYGVEAFAVCRDQIATDGFTIWGAPIAGYYPSKVNLWSPALNKENQIEAPVFRMLGQDPVYYYYRQFKLPSGRAISEPDTMEPAWTAGKSPEFIEKFLTMISEAPTLQFGYAQLGQENSFPWPDTAPGWPIQMEALAALRDSGKAHVETMGESGRRFTKAFTTTPAQAQVMLTDPFGNTPPERSAWYQSRYYRANLHFKGELPFLRDLTVYSDRNQQPFLTKATRQNDVEQRMPAMLDGYHWSKNPGALDEDGAGGYLLLGGQRVTLTAEPTVKERGEALEVELKLTGGESLHLEFSPKEILFKSSSSKLLEISFEWDPAKASRIEVQDHQVRFHRPDLDYTLKLHRGTARVSPSGWIAQAEGSALRLKLSQE
jgi:hypothetical protein